MSDIKKLKMIEDLGWEAFRLTGDINDYGIIASARQLRKEKQKEDEQTNGFGM